MTMPSIPASIAVSRAGPSARVVKIVVTLLFTGADVRAPLARDHYVK
jgi:hypothetical protein